MGIFQPQDYEALRAAREAVSETRAAAQVDAILDAGRKAQEQLEQPESPGVKFLRNLGPQDDQKRSPHPGGRWDAGLGNWTYTG